MEGSNVVCPVMISTAEPADFPSLASILPLANAKNPIHHLMFKRDTSLGNSQSPAERWDDVAILRCRDLHRAKDLCSGSRTHGPRISGWLFHRESCGRAARGWANRREERVQWDDHAERQSSRKLRLARLWRGYARARFLRGLHGSIEGGV